MSKKAVQKAIANVQLAAERQAYNDVMGSGESSYFSEVRRNAAALELLGIAEWVKAYDTLADAYYDKLRTERKFWEGVKTQRHVVVTAADL